MSKQTSSDTPQEEVDIYSDILTDQDEQIVKLTQKVEKISSEKALLIKSLDIQQKKCDELQSKYEELLVKYKTVSVNSSSLFKTAQAEVKRKDLIIQDLRRDIDNLVFRKTPVDHAIGRAKKNEVKVEEKIMSPMTKNKPTHAGPPPTSVDAAESRRSETKVCVESIVKQKMFEGNVEQKHNSIISPKSNTSSTPCIPPPSNIPPLLQGPVTEYSRRMYKRVYGVCPLEAESNSVVSVPDTNIKNSSEDNNFTEEKTVDNKSNQNMIKSPSIAAILQEEVKEYIRLGSKSTRNKSPQEKEKELSPVIKVESPKQTKKDPASIKQLVIHCEGKNDKSLELGNSPNVDINETINNILSNKVNGLYSSSNKSIEISSKFPTDQRECTNYKDKTCSSIRSTGSFSDVDGDKKITNVNLIADKEPRDNQSKKKKITQDSNKIKPNRLLANMNKRVLIKPVISPVTFGKLVSSELLSSQKSQITLTNKINKEETSTEKNSAERKIQRGQEVMSHVESDISFETHSLQFQVEKKKRCLTSLFGESPLKSSEVTIKEKYEEENIRSSVPQNVISHSDFSILPNSPSLDSDDPEDLIIDSSVCSRNTSPRVSESCEKNEDNAKFMSVITNTEPPLVSETKKQNVCSKTISIETPLEDITKDISVNKIELPHTAIDPSTNIAVNEANKISPPAANNTQENSKQNDSCLPDLSQCFSLMSKIHPEVEPKCPVAQVVEVNETDLSKLAKEPQSVNLPNETNTELNGYLSHSSSSEVNSGNNSSTCKSSEILISNVERFIPSPSQLTLISALKHSENSVFNIAEDTAGFVSALTRVRDISPIRTPDKKINQSITSDCELKSSVVIDGSQNNGNNIVKGKINSIPLVSFQNQASLEINNFDPDVKKSECNSSNLAENQFSNLFNKPKNSEFIWKEFESSTSKLTHFKFTSLEEKRDHEISKKNKPPEICISKDTSNVFKRSRPVRRIVLSNQTKERSSEKYNKENASIINSLSSFMDTKEVKSTVGANATTNESEHGRDLSQNNNVLSKVKESSKEENISSVKPAVSKMGVTNQTKEFSGVPKDVKMPLCNDSKNKNQVLEIHSSSKKIIITSPSNSEEKSFKRSVSLKAMAKPLHKINFDVLNRHEDKADKCLKQNHESYHRSIKNKIDGDDDKLKIKKQRMAVELTSDDEDKIELTPTLKSDINYKTYNKPSILIESLGFNKKKTTASNELEQSPHIANINKRTRVSNFHRIQSSIKLVEKSRNTVTKLDKSCLKENKEIKNSTLPFSKNSLKKSNEISNKSDCKSMRQQNPKTNEKLEKKDNLINKYKNSEHETSNVSPKSCSIKQNKKLEQTYQSQPCKRKSISLSPENKSKFETISKGLDDNHERQITQKKISVKENKNNVKEHIEKPQCKVLKTRNLGMDNNEEVGTLANCSNQVGRSKSNQRQSLGNSSQGNKHHLLRRSLSSSPEVRSGSNYVKKHCRTESKSPQPKKRSKSCLQPKQFQSKSPEKRKRSKSQHLKRSMAGSPDLKGDNTNYKSSYSRSPDPRLRSYHVRRGSRSRSRESGHPRKSEHSSRSRHTSFYKRYSPHYAKRSRSRSSDSYDRYKRSRGINEYHYKQSAGKSSWLSQKRKSRSLSPDSSNKFKRARQSNRKNSSYHQHYQSPNRIIDHNRKQTPQKSDNTADSQESLMKLEKLEKKFCFLTHEVHKKLGQTNGQLSGNNEQKTCFLDEIIEIKKEMKTLKSTFKTMESPSEDNNEVPKPKKYSEVCLENPVDCISLTNNVPQSNLKKANKLGTSKNVEGSSSLLNLQEVPKNNLEALPKILSVQSKPIPVIKYVKRRSRNLGDSDVTVVSSSTKLSKISTVISKPEGTKQS